MSNGKTIAVKNVQQMIVGMSQVVDTAGESGPDRLVLVSQVAIRRA